MLLCSCTSRAFLIRGLIRCRNHSQDFHCGIPGTFSDSDLIENKELFTQKLLTFSSSPRTGQVTFTFSLQEIISRFTFFHNQRLSWVWSWGAVQEEESLSWRLFGVDFTLTWGRIFAPVKVVEVTETFKVRDHAKLKGILTPSFNLSAAQPTWLSPHQMWSLCRIQLQAQSPV